MKQSSHARPWTGLPLSERLHEGRFAPGDHWEHSSHRNGRVGYVSTPGSPKARWSKARRSEQAVEVLTRLEREYPEAGIVLHFSNDWELLVSVILSAQCTDVMVNKVTADLFRKYHSVEDYAGADPAEFEIDIRPTGFFRNKTKHILGAARKLLSDFDGHVPNSMAELLTLPGVARKTANIVLGNIDPAAYAADPDSGIAVDTHVHRLSNRLGLVRTTDAGKTEAQLLPVVSRAYWFRITYLLIEHGRAICVARKPRCGECLLADICPSAFKA